MYSFGFEWTRLCTYPIFTEWLTVVSCTIVCSKSHAMTPCKFIWCFWMYQAYRYSPFIPRFFIKTFLKAVFTAKLRERSWDFPCTPCPSNTHNLPLYHPSTWAIVPLSATPPRVAHGVQLKDLHWHVTATRSQQLTLGPSPGVAVCESEDACPRHGTPQGPSTPKPSVLCLSVLPRLVFYILF